MNKCLELWCFEEPDQWQYALESWKGELKQMPETYYREQLMIRALGMTRKYNRKKISNCINPWFFHILHTVRCSAPHLRKDALLLENFH